MGQLLKTFIYSTLTIFLTFCLIRFPDQALEAGIRGLNMWWEVVFPSLLPFFITAELLLAFGVVNFLVYCLSQLCDPYSTFQVPGASAG